MQHWKLNHEKHKNILVAVGCVSQRTWFLRQNWVKSIAKASYITRNPMLAAPNKTCRMDYRGVRLLLWHRTGQQHTARLVQTTGSAKQRILLRLALLPPVCFDLDSVNNALGCYSSLWFVCTPVLAGVFRQKRQQHHMKEYQTLHNNLRCCNILGWAFVHMACTAETIFSVIVTLSHDTEWPRSIDVTSCRQLARQQCRNNAWIMGFVKTTKSML